MSRTMKDIPRHVIEEKAIGDGYLLPGRPRPRPRPWTGRFTVAVPEGDAALADDWISWMKSLGFSIRMQGTAAPGCIVTLSDRDEYFAGIGFIRDFPLGDRVVFDPISRWFLNLLDGRLRPERNALDPDMSIRGASVTVIGGFMMADDADADAPAPVPSADVDGWLAHKSRHDRLYNHCFHWRGRYGNAPMPRTKVTAALHEAVLSARAGRMDEGFDDPRLYLSAPDDSWYED